MAIVSRPVAIGLAIAVVIGAVYYFQDDSTPTVAIKPKVKAVVKKEEDVPPEFLPEDFVKRFDRAALPERNIFISPQSTSNKYGGDKANLQTVPSDLAGGDANWIFTGVATLDGKKMALLENANSHQGDYVTEGSDWKQCRIRRISSDGVAITPKSGGEELVVYRHKSTEVATNTPPPSPPNVPSLPPTEQIAPLNPQNLTGPIGNGMILRRRRGGQSFVIQSGN